MEDFLNAIEPASVSPLAVLFEIFVGILFISGIVIDFVLLVRMRKTPLSSPAFGERLRSSPWSLRDGVITLFCFIVMLAYLQAAVSLVSLVGCADDPVIESSGMLFQTLLMQGTALAIVIFLLRKRQIGLSEGFGVCRRNFARDIRLGIIFYLAALPVAAFWSAAYAFLLERMGFAVEAQDIIFFVTDPNQPLWLQLYLMLIAVTAAPLLEELIFRGIALPIAVKKLGVLPGAYLVSLGFSIIHVHPSSIVALFVMATAFSLAYLYTGSIVTPIVMHALFNGVNLGLILCLKAYGFQDHGV